MPGTARSKLNGWQRLGIVLSIFWMIAVGIECWVELRQGPFSTGWVTDTGDLNTARPRRENSVALPSLGSPVDQVCEHSAIPGRVDCSPNCIVGSRFSVFWVFQGFQHSDRSGVATTAQISEDAKWHWGEGNKYVIEAAKGILLVNGAASISTLTFIGNLKLHPTSALIFSMLSFALGAMLSAMIFAFAYFTQLSYGNANFRRAYKWHAWTYVVVLFSVAFFIAGIACAAYGFLNLP
jgi:hypothetical protein